MSNKSNKTTLTILFLVAFMALITGLFVFQHINHYEKKTDFSQFHGTLLQNPRDIESFNLQGIDNQVFDNQSLLGSWTLVFFGFTRCGYLCPTTMAEIAKMYHRLETQKIKPLPHVVMISIDPTRDSLEGLKNYVQAFDPHFYAARGEEAMVKKIAYEMGIAYSKVIPTGKKPSNPEDYDIQHSGALMLFNPKGQLGAFFTTPHNADLLAKDYLLLINQ